MKIKSDLVELHVFRIINNDLEFLLLKRSEGRIYPGIWQMVSGHTEKEDTAVQTAIRELKEETGLTPFKMWIAPNVNSFYLADDDSINMIPVFAVQVEDFNVKISEEHTEYKWLKAEDAKMLLAWDGQRRSVDLIQEYITSQMSFLKFTEISL